MPRWLEKVMSNCILNAQGLHRRVTTPEGQLTILNGVDLTVKRGQSVAILGESGSGKSTLLGLLAGLDLPQQGEIYINGQEITRLEEDQRAALRANKTGFVFQSFYLMEELTALENVALPLELFGVKQANKVALTWLEKLGLAERAKHFPCQLSGGEQQRVALSRAFAIKPVLLFADEPTANLDRKTASTVIGSLFQLQQEIENSMVLVTHDQHLADHCDVVYQLNEGKLYVV